MSINTLHKGDDDDDNNNNNNTGFCAPGDTVQVGKRIAVVWKPSIGLILQRNGAMCTNWT